MPKPTYERRLITGLICLGYKENAARRGKLRMFSIPGNQFSLFVGPNGALRSGTCASQSRSIGCPRGFCTGAYKEILALGDSKIATKNVLSAVDSLISSI